MSQEDEILNYLQQGYSITPIQALEKWGVFRLSGRIFSLKKQGYHIHSELVKGINGKHYSKYKLVEVN